MTDSNQDKWLDDVIKNVFSNPEHPYFKASDPRQSRAVEALTTVYNHRYPEPNGTVVSTAEQPDGFDSVEEAIDYLANVGNR